MASSSRIQIYPLNLVANTNTGDSSFQVGAPFRYIKILDATGEIFLQIEGGEPIGPLVKFGGMVLRDTLEKGTIKAFSATTQSVVIAFSDGDRFEGLTAATTTPVGTQDVQGPYVEGDTVSGATFQPVMAGLEYNNGNGTITADGWETLDHDSGLISMRNSVQNLTPAVTAVLTPQAPGSGSNISHNFCLLQIQKIGAPAWTGTMKFRLDMNNNSNISPAPLCRVFDMTGTELPTGTIPAGTNDYFYLLTGGFPFLTAEHSGGIVPAMAITVCKGALPFSIP